RREESRRSRFDTSATYNLMPPSYGSGSGLSTEGDRIVDSHDLARSEKEARSQDSEARRLKK
ncbi:MAG TPA: hypothetical protein V6D04_11865, partial [Candidatus Obscuribacterales bacterium]